MERSHKYSSWIEAYFSLTYETQESRVSAISMFIASF